MVNRLLYGKGFCVTNFDRSDSKRKFGGRIFAYSRSFLACLGWCGISCYLRGNIKGRCLCHASFLTEPPRRMELEEILLDPWLNKVKFTAVLGQKCHWFFKFLLGTIGALFEHWIYLAFSISIPGVERIKSREEQLLCALTSTQPT